MVVIKWTLAVLMLSTVFFYFFWVFFECHRYPSCYFVGGLGLSNDLPPVLAKLALIDVLSTMAPVMEMNIAQLKSALPGLCERE